MVTRKLKKVLCLIALGVIASAIPARADVITDWNNVMLEAIKTTGTNPPKASRAMAIIQSAVYDSVNSIDGSHAAYKFNIPTPGASMEAAAVESAYTTLSNLFPTQQSVFDAARASSLAAIPDGPAKSAGLSLGAGIGQQMLALRASDNSEAVVTYTPGLDPGAWRPTPAGFGAALLPGWGNVTPFTLNSGAQVRLAAPPALNSPEYAASLNQVKDLGSATSATRTPDQTNIALFWADGAGTVTPPGHWNKIAQTIALSQGNDLADNARLFALINLGMADAGIACWDSKYHHNLWRPIAAIREADTDGNDLTIADPAWTPLIATPPFPTYGSGHSTFSGAASALLARFYGTDNIAFSDTNANGTRSFMSFSQAALEAADSRLYGGIHYDFDNTRAYEAGLQIADHLYANFLSVPEPSSILLAAGACLFLIRRRHA